MVLELELGGSRACSADQSRDITRPCCGLGGLIPLLDSTKCNARTFIEFCFPGDVVTHGLMLVAAAIEEAFDDFGHLWKAQMLPQVVQQDLHSATKAHPRRFSGVKKLLKELRSAQVPLGGTALIAPPVPYSNHPHPSKVLRLCSVLSVSRFFLPCFSHGNAVSHTFLSRANGSVYPNPSTLMGLWTNWCGLATRSGPHLSSPAISTQEAHSEQGDGSKRMLVDGAQITHHLARRYVCMCVGKTSEKM